MKKLLSLIIILVCSTIVYGQTLIVDENFDSYIAGNKFVQQAGSPWTTWSNQPGSSEDPIVSDAQYVSSPNSLYIQNNNDLVLKLNAYTTGRYSISFKIFVSTGSLGYFNILNSFAGSSSVWAMQAYFKNNGYLVVDAGGASIDSIAYTQNDWHDVLIVVDLDNDIATIEFDEQFFHLWKFSSGTFGDGNMKKLDAIDFFGWSEGGLNANFYIDDMKIQEMPAPEMPINLTATLQNQFDIHLNWTAPTTIPNCYLLVRNDRLAAIINASETEYIEAHVYPQTVNYKLFSYVTSQGASAPALTQITIPGGVDRNFVLFEIATATNCPYCPNAARGINDLITNNANVAVINYHIGDSYATTDCNTRLSFYTSQVGTPTTWVDGVLNLSGGATGTTSLYSAYNPMYQSRISIPSVYINYININKVNDNQYEAKVSVKEHTNFFTSGLKLHVALVESHIPQTWYTLSELNYVCRKMYPSGNGTNLDFSQSDSLSFTFNINVDAGIVVSNCELIAFVQHQPTKEVIQTIKAPLDPSSIIQLNTNNINIYPSPASDYIYVSEAQGMHMQFINLNGQIVKDQLISSSNFPIYVNDLPSGVYIVTFAENPQIKQKVIIMH
jgi:hypothetical protein